MQYPLISTVVPQNQQAINLARRQFLRDCGVGLGKIALASLLSGAGQSIGRAATAGAENPLAPRAPHYAPKAKRVIHLFMAGAPSQLDLFDYKPKLAEYEGRPIPPEVIAGQRYAFIRPDAAVLGPRFSFKRYGESGAELSEMLPGLAEVVDEIAIVKSMHTDQFNHAPAQIFFNTGFSQPGRPSLGSWALYGLGAETSDLPAFVVMSTGRRHQRRRGQLVERVLADHLHRHAAPQPGRSDSERQQPGRHRSARCSASRST